MKIFFLNIIKITGKSNFLYLIGLFFCLILLSLLEFIGIGAIPIFISAILDPQIISSKLNNPYLLNLINETNKSDLIIYISIILIVVFLIKNLFFIFIIVFQGLLTKRIKLNLSMMVYKKYLNLEYIKLIEKNSSIMIRSLTLDVGNTAVFVLNIINLCREILLFLAICLLLFLASPIVSLVVFAFFGIVSLLFFFNTHKKIFQQGQLLQTLSSDKIKIINDTIGSIKEIKIFKLNKFLEKIFFQNSQKFEKYAFRNYFIKMLPRVILEIGAVTGIIILIISYVKLGKDITTLFPFLSLVVVSIIRVVPGLNLIQNAIATLKTIMPSFNHVLKELVDNNFEKKIENNKKETIRFTEKISIKNIEFSYPGNKTSVLKNISIEINKGDKIGIVGKSGTGKTTFVSIILGLLKPSSGNITVDNNDIDFSRQEWNNTAGYVPQEIFLLEDTIKNNITFGLKKESINLNLLDKICKDAQIKKFIESLPLKYDTMIGERGYNMSAGQKQRLGIARVLYRNPDLLILDEVTSSLDNETEKNFINDVFDKSKDKTIIFISHRLSALKKCNKIYDLSELK
jgi:ATP-binding cassette, subfamily B, bacterial PglK